VGSQIANQASFDPRNHGFKKFGDLLEASQLFELDRRGTHLYVRDKRSAKGPRTARAEE
jgi:OST-HTH/LOTUS domain